MQLELGDLQLYRTLSDPLDGETPVEYFRRHRDSISAHDVSNGELLRVCGIKFQAIYVEHLVERLKAKDAGTLDALVEAVILLLNAQYKP